MKNLFFMKPQFTFVILSLFLVIEYGNTFAQIIHNESFDDPAFPPSGWTITGGAGSQWVRRTTGTNPTCNPHSGAAMARFTVVMQPIGSQELMTSPVVDYSGASGSVPTLSLWIYRDNSSTAGDSLTILVNTINSLSGAVRLGAVARSRFFNLPNTEPANDWYQYSWNIPPSFNTDTNYILFNGTARGGGNIFIDDVQWTEYKNACSGTPITTITADDTLICGGSGSTWLYLTDSTTTYGGLTFQWQSGPSDQGPWTDFGNDANNVNTGTLSASAYFRCYVSCSNGGVTDTSAALLVAVSPNPAPSVSVTPGPSVNYCSGSPPVLFIASGANSYTWNPSLPTSVSGDSAFASPSSSTTYTVTGIDSFGCTGSAFVVVNAFNSPVIDPTANNDSICPGQNVFLQANLQGPGFGTQFLWQPGGLTGSNQNVSPQFTTTYYVTATTISTGCSTTDSVSVFVFPAVTAGFTYSVNNLTYTFTDTSSSGIISWLWNFGDGSTDTVQNPVHTYASNGTYTVILTVTDGNCTSTSAITIIAVSVQDLEFYNGGEISLLPNPTSGKTILSFTCRDFPVLLEVMNVSGKVILNKELFPVTSNDFREEFNISGKAEGIYFIRLLSRRGISVVPLVKY